MAQAVPAAGRRFRLASPTTALVAGAVVLALSLAEFPLASLAHQTVLAGTGGPPIFLFAPFGVIGFLVALRAPGNRLGWLLLVSTGVGAVSECASFYVVACYRLRPGTLPLGWVALLLQPTWSVAIVLIGLALRHPCRQRREPVATQPSDRLGGLVGTGPNIGLVIIAVVLVVSLIGQVISYLRSTGERRQQLKWLMGGFVFALACLLLGNIVSTSGGPGVIADVFEVLGLLALPACMGVAILRYRLYDIDRIISRTLAYALITGVLVGVYAGLVLLATVVSGRHSSVAIAAATLAVAALFAPLRRRVQRLVDPRFNRARYDADTMVAAFAAGLMDGVELDGIRADLAAVVNRALEPEQVWVWTTPVE